MEHIDEGQWFIINTLTQYEKKVREAVQRQITLADPEIPVFLISDKPKMTDFNCVAVKKAAVSFLSDMFFNLIFNHCKNALLSGICKFCDIFIFICKSSRNGCHIFC